MVLRVAVIGGGPAGLVTLKTLLEAQTTFPGVTIEAHLFEEHDDIGGVFSHQVYEGAEVSVLFDSAPSTHCLRSTGAVWLTGNLSLSLPNT